MTQLTHKPNIPARHRQSGAVSAPAARPIMSTTAAARSGAADRFMARPEIAETMRHGSNGFFSVLPSGNEARLALWRKWPDADRCAVLARGLEAELSQTADAEHVSDAIGGMLAAFPTGDRAAVGYREGLVSFLIEEAGLRGWSAVAVGRGCLAILRTSRFLPSAAEVIEAIAEAHGEIRFAAWSAGRAVELARDLELSLIEAGLIEVEDDGEGF